MQNGPKMPTVNNPNVVEVYLTPLNCSLFYKRVVESKCIEIWYSHSPKDYRTSISQYNADITV